MKITIMRLSLGAIIGIVSESAAAAPVLGAVISVVFALFFARHEPYAERSDNTLSITLAFSLVLFFLAALMIKVDATSEIQKISIHNELSRNPHFVLLN